jgi:TolB-like protein
VDEFWQRLKQRKLVQWAIAWVAFAFALLQGIDIVAQRFNWPAAVERYLILAMIVGFFVVLVLAWYHGEKGAQRVGGMEIMILAVLLAIGGGLMWRFGRSASSPVAVAGVARSYNAAVCRSGPCPRPSARAPDSAASAAASGLQIPVAAQIIPQKSVAVLPFANESGRQDEQFFSDGLSDDLITALSQFEGLKVISRNSAFQFRDSKDSSAEIGKLLGVAHLLEGSVQRSQNEVRITATLVNASDGSIVWSQRYDKPYKDLFALQDDITKAVADALKAKLLTAPGAVVQSDRPPSGNLAAYAAYQHGIAYSTLQTEAGTHQAIAAYQRAIALDPKYAAAYAQLSMEWIELRVFGGADTGLVNANGRKASATALALNPDSALGHQARAQLLMIVNMDWRGAADESRHALQLAPNDAALKYSLAGDLAVLGQVQKAVELTQQALNSDPRRAGWYANLGVWLTVLNQLNAAEQAVNTAIALQPGAVDFHEALAVVEILRGDASAALTAAQKEPPGPWHDIAMALALQIGPDRKAADAALKKLIADHAGEAAYQIAEVYALRRDPDETFKWLDRAWTTRDPGISYLLFDPFILRYRNDPRFAAFCKKVGLPTTTDAVAMK